MGMPDIKVSAYQISYSPSVHEEESTCGFELSEYITYKKGDA